MADDDKIKPPPTDFNPDFPCIYCDEPVVSLSVGGSAVCPWCDMGYNRDGTRWSYDTMKVRFANGRRRLKTSLILHTTKPNIGAPPN